MGLACEMSTDTDERGPILSVGADVWGRPREREREREILSHSLHTSRLQAMRVCLSALSKSDSRRSSPALPRVVGSG